MKRSFPHVLGSALAILALGLWGLAPAFAQTPLYVQGGGGGAGGAIGDSGASTAGGGGSGGAGGYAGLSPDSNFAGGAAAASLSAGGIGAGGGSSAGGNGGTGSASAGGTGGGAGSGHIDASLSAYGSVGNGGGGGAGNTPLNPGTSGMPGQPAAGIPGGAGGNISPSLAGAGGGGGGGGAAALTLAGNVAYTIVSVRGGASGANGLSGTNGSGGSGGSASLGAATLTASTSLSVQSGVSNGAGTSGGKASFSATTLSTPAINLTKNDGALSFNASTLDIGNTDTTLTSIDLVPGEATIGTLLLTGTGNFDGDLSDVSVGQLRIDGGTLKDTNWANLAGGNISYTNSDISLGGSGASFDLAATARSLSRKLTGAGGITKTGTYTLYLQAASDYTGGTTVSDGSLFVENSLGSGGVYAGAISIGDTLYFNQTQDQTLSGTISGAGMLIEENPDPAKLILSGNASGFSGRLDVEAGTLSFQGTLPSGIDSLVLFSGTTLDLSLATAGSTLLNASTASIDGAKFTLNVASGSTLKENDEITLISAGTLSGTPDSVTSLSAGYSFEIVVADLASNKLVVKVTAAPAQPQPPVTPPSAGPIPQQPSGSFSDGDTLPAGGDYTAPSGNLSFCLGGSPESAPVTIRIDNVPYILTPRAENTCFEIFESRAGRALIIDSGMADIGTIVPGAPLLEARNGDLAMNRPTGSSTGGTIRASVDPVCTSTRIAILEGQVEAPEWIMAPMPETGCPDDALTPRQGSFMVGDGKLACPPSALSIKGTWAKLTVQQTQQLAAGQQIFAVAGHPVYGWYQNNGQGWMPLGEIFLPFSTASQTGPMTNKLVERLDLRPILGTELYTGNGKDADEMMRNGRYCGAFRVAP
ncbi:MAG: autotransporter-associated beta strand repeat-containing protein [Betaproteobacteria bacterium]|nr:autotransporter-associated beta strand repeat-containing protein [Betaproteobacteria bacterium]